MEKEKKKKFLFLDPFQFPKSEKRFSFSRKKNNSVLELPDDKESAKVI